jgi:2-polyprenyl-3-methyl-5-hydroxy-6-metoxy-1,4-benzoquinol methylase
MGEMSRCHTFNGPRCQVASSQYYQSSYCTPRRLASYSYQIREVLALGARNVLEVGPGNGLVAHMLRGAGIRVVTLDLAPDTCADVLGSVTSLPFNGQFFDLVLCCEVLEHLPYEHVPQALREMRRVTRGHVVLSLPSCEVFWSLRLGLSSVGELRVMVPIPTIVARKHSFDGEHYWLVGARGYPLRRIIVDMKSEGLILQRTYSILENTYHRVFVLEALGSS